MATTTGTSSSSPSLMKDDDPTPQQQQQQTETAETPPPPLPLAEKTRVIEVIEQHNNNDGNVDVDVDVNVDDVAMMKQERRKKRRLLNQRRRNGLFICSVLYTLLFVGAFFGWGPMQLLLEENGAFDSKCENYDFSTELEELIEDEDEGSSSNSLICPSQKAALINVHFIATLTQIDAPLLGHLADHFGPRKMAYSMILCIWIGYSLLMIATSQSIDYIIYISFLFLSHGSWIGGLLTVQTGMYFPPTSPTRNRVIFILNSVFDSASMVYWALWGIGQLTGTTITTLLGGYLAVSILLLGTSGYYWTVAIPAHEEEEEENDEIENENESLKLLPKQQNESKQVVVVDDDDTTSKSIMTSLPSGLTDPSIKSVVGHQEEDKIMKDTNPNPTPVNNNNDEEGLEEEAPNKEEVITTDHHQVEGVMVTDDTVIPKNNNNNNSVDDGYIVVADRSPTEQLTSMPYILLAIFFAIHCSANQFVLTTTRAFLSYLGDDDIGNKYLSIFTLLTPASLLALPMVDIVLTKFGISGGLQCINVLAITYLLIRVICVELNGIQIFGFLIFSFYRCFLFGITLSSVPAILGSNVVGKATGLLYMSVGIFSNINIPLANYTVKQLDGNFLIPHFIYTILMIPCIGAAWGIGRAHHRDQEAKKEQQEQQQEQRDRDVLVQNQQKQEQVIQEGEVSNP